MYRESAHSNHLHDAYHPAIGGGAGSGPEASSAAGLPTPEQERIIRGAIGKIQPDDFKRIYDLFHGETVETIAHYNSDSGQPNLFNFMTMGNLPNYVTAHFNQRNFDEMDILSNMSPGEIVATYGMMHSPAVQKIAEQYCVGDFAFVGGFSTNGYNAEKNQKFWSNPDDPTKPGSERAQKEEETRERLEAIADQLNWLEGDERTRAWLTMEHDFGGTKLTGAELERMFKFLEDPENRKKIEDDLRDAGVDDDTIDEGSKLMNEYVRLKRLQKKRKLTEEEQKRLDEINRSEAFRIYSRATRSVQNEVHKNIKTEYSERKDTSHYTNALETQRELSRVSSIDKDKSANGFNPNKMKTVSTHDVTPITDDKGRATTPTGPSANVTAATTPPVTKYGF